MADNTSQSKISLTRGSRFGIECRLRSVYGCSPFASRIWLAYMSRLGMRCPMLESTMVRAIAAGRAALANLHGDACSASYNARRKLTFGEKVVREAVAREARGERWAMTLRQAG